MSKYDKIKSEPLWHVTATTSDGRRIGLDVNDRTAKHAVWSAEFFMRTMFGVSFEPGATAERVER